MPVSRRAVRSLVLLASLVVFFYGLEAYVVRTQCRMVLSALRVSNPPSVEAVVEALERAPPEAILQLPYLVAVGDGVWRLELGLPYLRDALGDALLITLRPRVRVVRQR